MINFESSKLNLIEYAWQEELPFRESLGGNLKSLKL